MIQLFGHSLLGWLALFVLASYWLTFRASARLGLTGSAYAPGNTALKLLIEAWQKTIEDNAYEDAVIFPVSAPRERLYNKLHIRKLSKFTTNTLANTADGTGLTYSANTEVEVTITPIARYIALNFQRGVLAQMDQSPLEHYRRNIMQGVAQAVDQDFAVNVASLVTNVQGGAARDNDLAFITGGMALLRSNVGSYWNPGQPAYYHFVPSQWDDIMSIPGITQANLRGDEANPLVKGLLHEGFGLRFVVTGNIYVDATPVAHNVLWLPAALGISFNERPVVDTQTFELAERLYVYVNYGTAIVWDERAVDMRTKAA